MFLKTFKSTIQIAAGLIAGLAIILLLLTWQFSKGPISLGFLSPYIEDAVNSGQPNFQLKMRDTILTWGGWDRSLDIRVLDVQILDQQGEVIGSVPELSFSLNRSALLKGRVTPTTVEVFGPRLRILRQKDGSFNIGFGGDSDVYAPSAFGFFEKALAGANSDHPFKDLKSLHIIGADLTVDDQILEKSWLAPSADIRLTRDEIGMHGEVSLILDVEGKQTELELLGRYRTADKRLEVTAAVDQILLAPFAPAFEEIKLLKHFKVPLKGSVSMSIPLAGGPQSIRFDVTGGAGELRLPEPFNDNVRIKSVALVGEYIGDIDQTEIEKFHIELGPNQLTLPAPFNQNLNINSLMLDGSYSPAKGVAKFDNVQVELGANWKVHLPGPIDHKMPLRAFQFEGEYDFAKDRLALAQFNADLQGPRIALQGTFSGLLAEGGERTIDIKAEGFDFPINDMVRYWPKNIGTNSYNWLTRHLADGTIQTLKANTRIHVTEKDQIVIEQLGGAMKLSGVSVDYLPPMPKARNVGANITFDQKSMEIKFAGGKSDGLTLDQGTVLLTGLNAKDQYAGIDLVLDGSLKSMLAYIDNKPLGFASGLRIDPKTASGKARTHLNLKFIIEHDLRMDQVEVTATSKITDVSLAKVFLDRGIHDSSLDLKVDNKGMTLTGEVNFEDIPAELVWRENFDKASPYRSRYDLSAVIKDVRDLKDLGLEMQPFSDDYLSGSIGANIRFTVFDDVDQRLEVSADITDASLQAPSFGWSKKMGTAGRAEITIDMERDVVVDIPKFSIKASGMNIKGAAKYGPDGSGLTRVEFDRIAFGRTDVKGALIPKEGGGWEVGLHGPSLDFSAYWEEVFSGEPGAQGKQSLLPNLAMAIEIDRVWIGETKSMESFSGTFAYENDIWKTFLVSSKLDSGANFNLSIQTGGDGIRRLALRSNDAGDALRFLEAYDSMRGGKLIISGTYDDGAKGNPLTGHLTVSDYRIVDAPALTHVLSIMALTGILDALSGEGIGFNSLEVPFEYHDGVIKLTDARATGVSLGFTAEGNIYRYADVVDIKGTVVPAYALNAAFGHIPILGALLTGGDKGGGVFAANYSMSGSTEEPKILVNPLSALTPGILRKVFGVFDKAEQEPRLRPGENLKISTP